MATHAYPPAPSAGPQPLPGGRRGKFVPAAGERHNITIAQLPGRMVPSSFGPSEVVFDLLDGRSWYVPQVVANYIYELRLGAGPAAIEVTVTGRKKTDLLIVPLQARMPAPEPVAPVVADPPPQPAPRPASSPAAGIQTQRMMAGFVVAIDAVAEAQAYLHKRGLGITLTADNITSAALSVYINACREGR